MSETAPALAPLSEPSGDLETAKQYQKQKLRLSLLSTALELIGLIVFLAAGLSLLLRSWVVGWTPNVWLQVVFYFAILGLAAELVSFPIDFIRGYRLEHRYRLSNQTFCAWLWDWIKSLGVGGLLGLAVAELVYALLRGAGAHWWWIAAISLTVLMVVLAQLAPVILLPLFYKTRPLERPDLKQRLIKLAEKCGARVVDVFQLDLSAKTKAANAALAGLGHTRRILLGDTLLESNSDEEIEAVIAHELGHHHHAHLWKGIAAQTGLIFLGFFLADFLLHWGVAVFGFEGPADLAAFPLLALCFTGLALLLLPAINGMSRSFERQADRFAAEITGRPQALASALGRLARQNLADPDPHPAIEFLFYSHPSIRRRIQELGVRG